MSGYPITSDKPMEEQRAERMLERIREIMKITGLPFAPAVDVYIKEQLTDPRKDT